MDAPSWLTKALGEGAADRLQAAVREAEGHTSAEVAVFIKEYTSRLAWLGIPVSHQAVRRRAERLFVERGLDRTAQRNAVMVYISVRERAVVVLGDEGIHARLGTPAWEALVAEALQTAKARGPLDGLVGLVVHLGQQVGQHFPRAHDDVNELPDAPHVG